MKKILSGILTLMLLCTTLSGWTKDIAPDQLVKSTVDEVIAIIKQDNGIKKGEKDRVLDLVENKILPHFNFTRMTQLAMGKNWSKVEPQQQKELINEFQTLLVRTYSNALTNYRDEVIEVNPLSPQSDPKNTTVKTVVIQKGKNPVTIRHPNVC